MLTFGLLFRVARVEFCGFVRPREGLGGWRKCRGRGFESAPSTGVAKICRYPTRNHGENPIGVGQHWRCQTTGVVRAKHGGGARTGGGCHKAWVHVDGVEGQWTRSFPLSKAEEGLKGNASGV